MRKDKDELKKQLCKKYNVNNIYSFSSISTFEQDPYEYYLKYVANIEPDKNTESIYGILGTLVHDLTEKFYTNKLSRKECKEAFSNKFKEILLNANVISFSSSEESNASLADKYQSNILKYFNMLEKEDGSISCEEPVYCYLSNSTCKAVLFGYIDCLIHKKDKTYTILDFKTSAPYTNKDLFKQARQLFIYAEGIKQKYNCNYSDIKLGWNFVKYVKAISKIDMSEEIIERRYINEFDPAVYIFKDYIKYIDLTPDMIDDLSESILTTIYNIENKTDLFNKSKDDNIFSYKVAQQNLFRLQNFCNYSEKLHKPLREFLEGKVK